MSDNLYMDLEADDVARIRAHRERAEADEREWRTARLHHRLHGTWLGPDECPTCIREALNVEGDPHLNGAFG